MLSNNKNKSRELASRIQVRAAAIVSLLVVIITTHTPSTAATFRRLCDLEDRQGMACTIEMSGEIRDGDTQRLSTVLASDRSRIGGDRFLLLESLGGDIREALRIGEVVKSAMLITTLVRIADMDEDKRRHCVSACVLVFLAGADRLALKGKLGIHRPNFDPTRYQKQDPLQISRAQIELEDAVRGYAQSHGVSDQLIGKMMAHSSKDVYWLSKDEQSALEGEQSWYQEIMIATCRYDPSREAAIIKKWGAGAERLRSDSEWLSRAYKCINDRIAQSQRSLFRGELK
jgi:hypothetical protein